MQSVYTVPMVVRQQAADTPFLSLVRKPDPFRYSIESAGCAGTCPAPETCLGARPTSRIEETHIWSSGSWIQKTLSLTRAPCFWSTFLPHMLTSAES